MQLFVYCCKVPQEKLINLWVNWKALGRYWYNFAWKIQPSIEHIQYSLERICQIGLIIDNSGYISTRERFLRKNFWCFQISLGATYRQSFIKLRDIYWARVSFLIRSYRAMTPRGGTSDYLWSTLWIVLLIQGLSRGSTYNYSGAT